MTRTLALRRETLAELTTGELSSVAGGTVTTVAAVEHVVREAGATRLRCAISFTTCIATCKE